MDEPIEVTPARGTGSWPDTAELFNRWVADYGLDAVLEALAVEVARRNSPRLRTAWSELGLGAELAGGAR